MKLLAPALIFCGASVFGQSPQVPHKMQFAGMTLSIRDDARREIQAEVDALTRSPKYFELKAERARTYFPIVERIFAEERLPEDFKYLSLQESALVPDAVSTSNAVGFWQFKDFTAREMGLRVDEQVDERMNIASSSRGAAKYLKQCNHYFNNWVYALQSYQMGAGGVMRAVGDKDLGSRHMEINSDTYWYVKKFLAHKVAFESAMGKGPELTVQSFTPEGGTSVAALAESFKVDEAQLRAFNKWLKTEEIPGDKPYVVIVPGSVSRPDFGVLAVSTSTKKPVSTPVEVATGKEHINGLEVLRSRESESLLQIAERGGIGLSALIRYNEISIDYQPGKGEAFFLSRKKKKASQELYTVHRGENLWMVSQRMGVTTKALRKLNRLEPGDAVAAGTTLYLQTRKPAGQKAGEVLQLDAEETFEWSISGDPVTARSGVERKVSAATQADSKSADSGKKVEMHEVKSSDTLYSVARQYGVTIQQLMQWNDKKDFSLSVGEQLRVQPR